MDLKKRLFYTLMAVFIVVMGGSLGYYLIFGGQETFLDCLYMTVISLTTVGYGEVIQITGNPSAQIYTMLLIPFGMGIIVYGVGAFTALLIEGEISGILRKHQMENQIRKLKNHYIVCGGGGTGRHILAELQKNLEKAVLIDIDIESIEKCQSEENLLYIQGDATEDQHLLAAGIDRAAGIVICLPSDKDNLYITMTARMLSRRIRIISKMVDQKLRPKLQMAGADGIVSPNFIGALRMASEMIRPTAVDFLDSMLRSSQGDLRIHQITVPEGSNTAKKTIAQMALSERFGILVMGLREPEKEIVFNPPPTQILRQGTDLIVMGRVADIAKAKAAI